MLGDDDIQDVSFTTDEVSTRDFSESIPVSTLTVKPDRITLKGFNEKQMQQERHYLGRHDVFKKLKGVEKNIVTQQALSYQKIHSLKFSAQCEEIFW